MRELIAALLTANLAAGAAILLIAALRKPVRAGFGARTGYLMWLLVPLAALASLAPPRSAELLPAPPIGPAEVVKIAEQSLAAGPGPTLFGAIWVGGALATAVWLALCHLQFVRAWRLGRAGPAVMGVFKPAIIVPSDFETRFDRRERAVVMAHETVHLRRHDAQANALVALARCLCWFNPLIHLGAQLMRVDQELACDAVVIESHPKAKGAYAQALLKAHLTTRPMPLGCHWLAKGEHPLMQRLSMLKADGPSDARRLAGGLMVGVLALAGGYAAWTVAPAAVPAAAAPLALVEKALEPVAPKAATKPVSRPVKVAATKPKVHIAQAAEEEPINITGVVVRVDNRQPYGPIWVYGRGRRMDGADLGEQLWLLEHGPPRGPPTMAGSTIVARAFGNLNRLSPTDAADAPGEEEIKAAQREIFSRYIMTNAMPEEET